MRKELIDTLVLLRNKIRQAVAEKVKAEVGEEKWAGVEKLVKEEFEERKYHVVRKMVTEERKRIDGRDEEAVRAGHVTLDGIKYFTRAQMGRCQGGFCTYRILRIIARETIRAIRKDVLLNGKQFWGLVPWFVWAAYALGQERMGPLTAVSGAMIGALMTVTLGAREDKFHTTAVLASLPVTRRTFVQARYLLAKVHEGRGDLKGAASIYRDETDRFRWAGRLWREADPARLSLVLDSMVARGVAWDPTLVIYEASRDLQRAQSSPWFRDYLHPALEAGCTSCHCIWMTGCWRWPGCFLPGRHTPAPRPSRSARWRSCPRRWRSPPE